MGLFGLGLRGAHMRTARPAGFRHDPVLSLLEEAQQRINRLDAEALLAHLLGISRAELYIYPAPSYCYGDTKEAGRGGVYEDEIKPNIIDKFNAFVDERASGKPIQYILGKAEFMGFEFIVTPDVLIPRPETELLVETAVNILNTQYSILNTPYLLDLGTGSGNIAIALTKFITDCKIISSDVSTSALCIARENARLNLVDKKTDFVLSDLFDELPKTKFDIIVSNPPYVASSQIEELSEEISFEPRLALDGGPDGLVFYKNIIKASRKFLREKGFLMLEIGFGQTREVKGLLDAANFINIKFIKDYNNINRVAVAQWIN